MAFNRLLKKKRESPDDRERREDAEFAARQTGSGPESAAAPDDESNWLVSYADMMTLLCGFFIMLFSMAKLDQPQYEKVKESIAKQFGGEYKDPAKETAKFITQVLQEAGIERESSLRYDARGVAITFKSTLFFDTLSSEVKADGQTVLAKLIQGVSVRQQEEKKSYRIVIEGHTDSRPIIGGVFPSNWELSSARAARVVRMFLDRGFSPERLTAIGYADTYPELPARTTSGEWDERALTQNRRVVVRILDPSIDAIPFPEGPVQGPQPAGVMAVLEVPGNVYVATHPSALPSAEREPASTSIQTAAGAAPAQAVPSPTPTPSRSP